MRSLRTTRPSASRRKQPLWRNVPASAGTLLQAARARLAATSQNPRRDAELLLAHVLGWDQAALITYPERVLSEAEAAQYESYVARRLNAEPIQYITGLQEFYGLAFAVTPDVLIPRPETEHLVEAALARIPPNAAARILDVGTGSGAIAVTLAHALPQANVTAVDLSAAALAVAQRNAQRHGVAERINFQHSDLLAGLGDAHFDAIVANPPYIAEGEVLEAQVAAWEPHAALFAGKTGLEVYERLIPQASAALHPSGWLMLEIGFGQHEALQGLLAGWHAVTFVNDLQGISRVALAQKP
jgi:release factor glutamine methyltransferase